MWRHITAFNVDVSMTVISSLVYKIESTSMILGGVVCFV